MGKIIRNGIEFCGTSDTADNIIYDNTDSGLAATNTQTAIDELSEKVKSGGNIMYLTQAQYDALPESKESDDVEYRITDAGTMAGAENVGYDNSKSGIEAVNVQDAIDKLDESLEEILNNSNSLKIDCGVTTATSSSTTINFTKDFIEPPAVVANVNANGGGILATVNAVTTTSAKFYFWSGTQAFNNGVTFHWIAVGK